MATKTRVPAETGPQSAGYSSRQAEKAPAQCHGNGPAKQSTAHESHSLQRATNTGQSDPAAIASLGAFAGNRAAVHAIQRATASVATVQRDPDDEPASSPTSSESETAPPPADLETEFDANADAIIEALPEGGEVEPGTIASAFTWLSQAPSSVLSGGLDLALRGMEAITYYSGEFQKWVLRKIINMLAARGFDMSGIDEARMAEHLTRAGDFIVGEIDELPIENVVLNKGDTRVHIGAGTLKGLHFRFSVVDLLSAGFTLDEVNLDPINITKGDDSASVQVALQMRGLSVDIGTNIPQVIGVGLLNYLSGPGVARDPGLDSGRASEVVKGLGRTALAEMLSAKEQVSQAIQTHAASAVGMKIASINARVFGAGSSHDVTGSTTLSATDLSFGASQVGGMPGKKAIDNLQVSGRFEASDILASRLAGTPFIEGGNILFEMGADGNGQATATLTLHKSEVAKLAKDFVEVDEEHASRWKKMKAAAKKAALTKAVKTFVSRDHRVDIRVPIVNGVMQLNAMTLDSSSGRLVEWAIRRYRIRGLAPVDVNTLIREKLSAKLTGGETASQTDAAPAEPVASSSV